MHDIRNRSAAAFACGTVLALSGSYASGAALPMKINCGSNSYGVAGWEQDDAYVSGGSDWTNPDTVDTAGVANAAPAQVYKSVRHGDHSYSFGSVPNGTYTVRLHFADAYSNRSMDYVIEGVQVLDNFDISSEAGGTNKALVKEFSVPVTDGDGLQILCTGDSGSDVFEAGIEIIGGGAVIINATAGTALEEGAVPDTFTVTRSDVTPDPLPVDITVGGTAAEADYTLFSAATLTGTYPDYQITIPADEPSATITITPDDDSVDEGDETVTITVQPGADYGPGDPSIATVTIVDNEAPTVWIEATDADATENPVPTTDTGEFTIYRSGGPGTDVTVDITIGSSGGGGSGYTLTPAVTTTAVVPAGSPGELAITLTPVEDEVSETNELVTVTLVANQPTYFLSIIDPTDATVTIIDDDGALVTMAATVDTTLEGGSTPGEVTIYRGGATTGELTIDFTVGGTAVEGADYTLSSTATITGTYPNYQILVPVDADSVTIEIISVNNDVQSMPFLTVTVTVVDSTKVPPEDYILGTPAEATVTIEDDDIYIVAFDLDAPADAASIEVDAENTFTWYSAAGSAVINPYTLVIATDALFTENVRTFNARTETSIVVPTGTFDYLENYYWKVTAYASEGGGTSRDSDTTRTFTTSIDTTPPAVVRTEPSGGDDGVEADVKIVIRFSEPMHHVDTESAFSITPPVAVGTPSWSVIGKIDILTYTPPNGLAWKTPYTVTIAATARDMAADPNYLDSDEDGTDGEPIEDDYTFTFTTAKPLVGLVIGPGCSPDVCGPAGGAGMMSLVGMLLAFAAYRARSFRRPR